MQILTKKLIEELSWIQRFIEKKTTIPILADVLFEVDGTRLALTATDLEFGGVTTLEGRGRQAWSVAAPVVKLIKYLGKIEEEEVTLGHSETHELVITHGKASCLKISGMSKESFPELPQPPAEHITLSRLPLAIQRTAFAISAEESRFTLNGALLEIENGEAHLISTDGHRLSRAPLIAKGADALRVLLPKKALLEAARFEDACQFATDESHAFFEWGSRRMISRKLTGKFPEWQRVVGNDFPNYTMLPVQSTLKTLDRVALYADERSHCVRFLIADGKLVVRAQSVEEGAAEGVVPATGGHIEQPLEMGFNASYVTEYLRQTGAQFVALCWSNENIGEDGKPRLGSKATQFLLDGWQYVVMPMRV